MDAKQYAGIDLAWGYDKRELIYSMDEYVTKALSKFQHRKQKQHHYGPLWAVLPDYGANVQYLKDDETAPLSPDQIRHIQRNVDKFLFMGRALNNTMLNALNGIACTVSKGTEAILAATTYILNYTVSNPTPRIRHPASNMILYVESDAAYYLMSPQALSRAGDYHCL